MAVPAALAAPGAACRHAKTLHPALLADQSEVRCADAGMEALGWQGAAIETVLLRAVTETDGLRFKPDAAGRPTRVVVDLDGEAFAETWIDAVEAAQRPR